MQPRVRPQDAGRIRAFLRDRPAPLPLPAFLPEAADGCPDGDPAGRPEVVPGGSAPPSLDDLRRAVAVLEGRIAPAARLEAPRPSAPPAGGMADPGEAARPGEAGGRFRLGAPAFDGLFAGGLPLGALHMVRTDETRAAGAACGFLAALAASLGEGRRGPVLWVRDVRAAREAGRPAALGLAQLGLDPSRVLVVEVGQPADVLWAVEEGLGCPGLSVVIGEMQGLPRALDLTASRRLALRARESGVPLFLALQGAPPGPSAAATRFLVAPRPSEPVDGFTEGAGFPAWTLVLEKNRDGRTGRLDLEWNSDERRFKDLAPRPLPVDLAAPAADRSSRPPPAGAVVAFQAGRRSG
ncbi:ImuA family protein [Chthonobacter rhizosphaerae]|uniref:ImuA family protein n=1 Tax=Chthonobacter rhizosphaerae TaxID=2735553 RepID=UPI0015EEE408|nr:inducible mutagenesis protein A [Chthonobacter rhizosphaerae]